MGGAQRLLGVHLLGVHPFRCLHARFSYLVVRTVESPPPRSVQCRLVWYGGSPDEPIPCRLGRIRVLAEYEVRYPRSKRPAEPWYHETGTVGQPGSDPHESCRQGDQRRRAAEPLGESLEKLSLGQRVIPGQVEGVPRPPPVQRRGHTCRHVSSVHHRYRIVATAHHRHNRKAEYPGPKSGRTADPSRRTRHWDARWSPAGGLSRASRSRLPQPTAWTVHRSCRAGWSL